MEPEYVIKVVKSAGITSIGVRGDEIANNIWRNAMSIFGEKVDHHFHLQTSTTNHIYVGLNESPTNVCLLHFSKNSFIKPHVDSLDIKSSIITRCTAGASLKCQFALHQYLYKFQTNNKLGLFVKSENICLEPYILT